MRVTDEDVAQQSAILVGLLQAFFKARLLPLGKSLRERGRLIEEGLVALGGVDSEQADARLRAAYIHSIAIDDARDSHGAIREGDNGSIGRDGGRRGWLRIRAGLQDKDQADEQGKDGCKECLMGDADRAVDGHAG